MSRYFQILEDAWNLHLAERSPGAPTVISTFAGGGGSSLGYSMAGFKELLVVEWDNDAVETFRTNFPDVPVYHGDITELSVEKVFELTGLKAGELDVFDGSPPCQGFSTAGKREFHDSRNQLFREYVRLLRGLKPKVFVMENVSGMVKGKMKLIFAEIMRELKTSGYKVSAKLLNAKYFNVPQSRERMIFIGVRDDLPEMPSHPKALAKPIPVQQAFAGLPAQTADKSVQDWFAKALKEITWQHNSRDITKVFIRHKGTPGGSISTKRLAWHLPSNAVCKSEIAVTGLIHPEEDRYLTQAELQRIGSFPDSFNLLNRENAVARIGNSVPPLLMKAVAEHICREILHK